MAFLGHEYGALGPAWSWSRRRHAGVAERSDRAGEAEHKYYLMMARRGSNVSSSGLDECPRHRVCFNEGLRCCIPLLLLSLPLRDSETLPGRADGSGVSPAEAAGLQVLRRCGELGVNVLGANLIFARAAAALACPRCRRWVFVIYSRTN